PPTRLEHPRHLREGAVKMREVLDGVKGVDLVERLVRKVEALRVHHDQITDDAVGDRFGIEIDAGRRGTDAPNALGEKSAAAADFQHAVAGPRSQKRANTSKVPVDFDR